MHACSLGPFPLPLTKQLDSTFKTPSSIEFPMCSARYAWGHTCCRPSKDAAQKLRPRPFLPHHAQQRCLANWLQAAPHAAPQKADEARGVPRGLRGRGGSSGGTFESQGNPSRGHQWGPGRMHGGMLECWGDPPGSLQGGSGRLMSPARLPARPGQNAAAGAASRGPAWSAAGQDRLTGPAGQPALKDGRYSMARTCRLVLVNFRCCPQSFCPCMGLEAYSFAQA